MAGLPPLFGFISKEAMFKATAQMSGGIAVAVGTIAVAAAICTFAYSARMVLAVLRGQPGKDAPREGGADLLVPVGAVALAGVVLGVAGPVAEPLVDSAARAIGDGDAAADLSLWHGVTPELGMTAAVVVVGVLLVLARHRVDRLLDRPLSPVRATDVVEGFRSGSIALGGRIGDLTGSTSLSWPAAAPIAGTPPSATTSIPHSSRTHCPRPSC